MSARHFYGITYEQRFARAVQKDVTPREFEEAALYAGWQVRTVSLIVKPPHFDLHYLVGRDALRIRE